MNIRLVYAGFRVVGILSLVVLVGLWRWQRWAVALYGILVAASVVLGIVAQAPIAHQATVIASAVVLFALAFLNRRQFRAEARKETAE
jgi:uncharacterized membrane protein (DUF2068 family)